MSSVTHFTIDAAADGQRLDRWLKKTYPTLSFGQVQKLIRTGQIRIDGKRAKADTTLLQGQDLRLPPIVNSGGQNDGQKRAKGLNEKDRAFIRSLVIYEDNNLIALNKPPGLAVQGGTKTTRHIDGMLEGLKGKDGFVPKLVHRIDKDTSGLLLLAKTNNYARILTDQFKSRDIRKTYLALCSPAPTVMTGTIKAKLVKAVNPLSRDREQMIEDEKGKTAATDYSVIDIAGKDIALVAFFPRTGRTHQIRAHCQIIGSPILGDPKYRIDPSRAHNDEEAEKHAEAARTMLSMCSYKGLHLHAYMLTLFLPGYGARGLTLKAPLTQEMRGSLRQLGFAGTDPEVIDPFTNP